MIASLTGFAVVAVAIFVGWVIGRVDLLGEHARPVLARLTFFVLSPFLLFVVLAHADVRTLFSALLPVSAIAALTVFALYVVVARFVWRRRIGEVVIGSLSAGQVNSNNIGLPLSLYLLGSAAYPAPVILMQLLVLAPITIGILDAVSAGSASLLRTLRRVVTNPIVVGSALGAFVSVTGIRLPPLVMQPAELIANACVPVLLIGYGISLYGQRVLGSRGRRRDILVATGLMLLVMPVAAWATAKYLFHLSPHAVLVVTVLAALPTAQNVFAYSQRYGVAEPIARDTVLLTTVGCAPVLFLITLLLR